MNSIVTPGSQPTMREADVAAILGAPAPWPSDVVQIAYQKPAVQAETNLKSLHQHALDNEWFPSDLG